MAKRKRQQPNLNTHGGEGKGNGDGSADAVSRKKKKQQKQNGVEEKGDVGGGEDHSSWSKSKKKRMRLLRKKKLQASQEASPTNNANLNECDDDAPREEENEPSKRQKSASSSLVESFKARLSGSRFRSLNEELYTTPSQQSFERFTKDPSLFQEYHDGFRHQVNSWPINPISVLCQKITQQAQKRQQPKYGTKSNTQDSDSTLEQQRDGEPSASGQSKEGSSIVVADFGCGEAQLAQQLLSFKDPSQPSSSDDQQQSFFQVHSFDLVAPAKGVPTRHLVTPCDMASVPLPANSVDVGVFCLSLMGTNLADFVREAHRVLKPTGTVWLAEVQSRFFAEGDNKKGKKQKQHLSPSKKNNDTQLQDFLKVLEQLGFQCVKKDFSNKMFFVLQLVKNGKKPNKKVKYTAKPCIYKRR